MNSVEIVAELTTNHHGDRERLEHMIRLSADAGADYVKLQKRDVETFYTQEALAKPYDSPFGLTFRDYRHQLELNAEDFVFVDRLCGELGIGWFASVLDRPSYEFMQEFNPGLIKLPSTISEHIGFLEYVAENCEDGVVISTGMTGVSYESFILSAFGRAKKLYILQCNSAYPTPPDHCNVGVISHYRDLSLVDPRIVPGYSSHDIGSMGSMAAVAAGARMIEKHVKIGNTAWAHFDDVALDLADGTFGAFVTDIRQAEVLCGSDAKVWVPGAE